MFHTHRPTTPYRSVWVCALAIGVAALSPAPALARSLTFSGIVLTIHDGDTISVARHGQSERVRLAGIDCPELRQAFGPRARNFTTRLASGQMVTVRVQGSDDRGAKLGVVVLPDGRSLNRELVAAGLAWKLKTSKNKELAKLEQSARHAKRGLWADPDPTPPWEYRKARNTGR